MTTTFMTTTESNPSDRLARLPVRADEDPFTVAVGGFYRRWFSLLDDIDLLVATVAKLTDTVEEDREHYSLGAVDAGVAALIVDGPGTEQTTFPHTPEFRSSRGSVRST